MTVAALAGALISSAAALAATRRQNFTTNARFCFYRFLARGRSYKASVVALHICKKEANEKTVPLSCDAKSWPSPISGWRRPHPPASRKSRCVAHHPLAYGSAGRRKRPPGRMSKSPRATQHDVVSEIGCKDRCQILNHLYRANCDVFVKLYELDFVNPNAIGQLRVGQGPVHGDNGADDRVDGVPLLQRMRRRPSR